MYDEHFGRVHHLSIVSSFSDGLFYQGCYTLYKFTASDILQLMVSYYGVDVGHKMYGSMMKVALVMANAPAFKLMLVYLKVLIHFACKTETGICHGFNEAESVLLLSLNKHLENISVKHGFSEDVALVIDWSECDHFRWSQHVVHCKTWDQLDIYTGS